MDRILGNEINTRDSKTNNEINDFIVELQNALDDPKSKISIDKSLYNEIYSTLDLAPKFKDKLENIIKKCILDYSYDNEFFYLNFDEKSNKYYMDIYSEGITKVELTKKEIQDADYRVGAFYIPIPNANIREEECIKDAIKNRIEYELNELNKDSK